MSLGTRIAELRTKHDMTQEELANRLFVSRELVVKWEKDSNRPGKEVLNDICNIFQVGSEYFESEDEYLARELNKCIPKGVDINGGKLLDLINEFLKTLPPKERNVFIRRYYFSETPEQIGEKYSIGKSYIYVCLSRSRLKLRKFLKEKKGLV